MKYTIVIAGSSKNTVLLAQTIASDPRFEIILAITPTAKLVGRQKTLTKNPLQLWAEEQKIATFLVEKKIEKAGFENFIKATKRKTTKFAFPFDFLLVVDFGYFIPSWLLKLPKIAPLNVHPSLLPRWRGSSPGQFYLLLESFLQPENHQSAVTLMIMNQKLDQGPIIAQVPFNVETNWTQNEYYQTAFTLMQTKLTDLINDFATGKIQAKEQAINSPTMTARKLTKADSFIAWQNLVQLMSEQADKISSIEVTEANAGLLQNLLIEQKICPNKLAQIQLIINASKAFTPWPNLWTIIPTNKGTKRMKILSCYLATNKLLLKEVQIEGKNICLWNETKNALIN